MGKDTKLTITTLMIAALTIGTDFTGVLLLVTPIERDFSVDITTTQWVLNIYALTFGIFIVSGGRLGDIYGHRRQILVGLTIFLIASIGCLAAPSIGWLIGSRAVQGIGAALLWPCILALGTTSVDEDKRGLAMGLILAGVTGGNVAGPLIAGVVTWIGDWRLFFLVNTLMAVLTAALVLRFLRKESPGKTDKRIDIAGMAVLGFALLALLYGLDVGADWGWTSPALVGLLVLSAVLFVAFPFVEPRVKAPLVPPSLMRNREFVLILSTNGLLVPALFIAFLYFPQYLQKTMGWSVLAASFGMLPLMVLLSVGSVLGGRLYDPIGPRRLLLAGYALVALGAATIVFFMPSWGYFAILPAMILMGLGATLCVGTAGTAAVSAVPPSRAGVAGGLSFMAHLCTGALGVAGATAIMNAETAGVAQAGMSKAFAAGMSHAYWLATALAILGIAVAAVIDEKKLQAVPD
ncbi:MAG: MFS transporter [Alphaproteobacteria bacterium]|nr:MFS transporter [Alphaproteobacteria bacterium]